MTLRRIELYGRLRDAGLGDSVEIELSRRASAREALVELSRRLGAKAELLRGAALASESEVLSASAPVPENGRLAALPPVCGG